MACNFLTAGFIDENANADNLSEVSEAGTGTSGWDSNLDSKEDLADFIAKLGLKDATDLYQDRFRVDRKKLEQMLTGGNEMFMPADVFFAKVMEDTNTHIFWPNKLKIGAKSKKDPHIRIAGRPDDVQAARERIMNLLDTRSTRITMKMDVSYTDHSHIIGRGGLCIKRVMEETQCHVHFPDSNRVNLTEKSNQVSISGDIRCVEKARSRVRDLIPLIFGFELPITSKNIDTTSAYIAKVQEQFKVQVMFKTRPKLHATLVLVKGVEWEAEQVKRATLLLIEYMCENLANQTAVQMSMEISPQHHPVVLGKNHSNLKTIMKYTNCQIMFPDAQDPNIANLKKSNVNISGNIDDVYRARQLLMGCLPLIIIFDIPEDCPLVRTRPDQLAEIQAACDVIISIRQKSKQNIKACVIKGIEKHANNIYKARNLILGIDDNPIIADIPISYHFPALPPVDLIPTPTNLNPPTYSHSPLSPIFSPFWHYPAKSSPSPNATSPFFGMLHQPHFIYNVTQQSLASSGYHSVNQSQFNSLANYDQPRENGNSSLSSISTNNSLLSPCYRHFPDSPSDKRDISPMFPDFPLGNYQPSPVDNHKERSPTYDIESRRLAGLRAMQSRINVDSYRVPNNFWSGYGISHSSPGKFADERTELKTDDDIWRMPPSPREAFLNPRANTSNLLDHTSSHLFNRITNTDWFDLAALLTSLGLERYISLFTRHDIDMAKFSTLTERDLIRIGVNTTETRKRMLLSIYELNRRSGQFSAAPGSERRKSTTSTFNFANLDNRW